MLNLDGVVVLMALARHGTLVGASRALGLPRSTLTRRLAQLEEELGVRLVERTSRHLRLTSAGTRLVEQGAPLVDAARQLEVSVRAGTGDRVRIALPPGLGLERLEATLQLDEIAQFGLGFELVFTDREVHPIRDDFDLVVSFAEPTDGNLFRLPPTDFEWRCVATSTYLERSGAPESAEALEDHACIALQVVGGVSPFAWPLRDGGTLPVNPRFLSTSSSAVLEMVYAHRGIALLPDSLTLGDLVPVLPETIRGPGRIYGSMGQRLSDTERGRELRALLERAGFDRVEAMRLRGASREPR
ncbi:transcriptional regulator, LysR family protein [Plesiocystis pacifica SIR-1]|uniref:Transcriptional regulator, LysR family protein n=1 Tax=Plesiocystis pacifica SIR-1 TaxID=391625 RepID=A6GDU9_9BACT|nr:LysR family transcriptional regulator [Plesiocystis pacifica]EDM75988.1 transcriptional regulator, LysR family protein [Plesiocystis pacifica SIR-1]